MFHMPQRLDSAFVIKEARATLPDGQIWSSTVYIDAHTFLIPHIVARVDISWLNCR